MYLVRGGGEVTVGIQHFALAPSLRGSSMDHSRTVS